MITDDALRAAAKEVSLTLARTLEDGSRQQPPYVPSKSFTHKMNRLCRHARHPVFHRAMQRAAVVFLVLLLTGAGWVTVDGRARAAALTWFRNISQNGIVYQFLNPAQQLCLPDYIPTWLPDGFEEQEHYKDEQRSCWYYVSGSDFIVIEIDVYHSGMALSLTDDYSSYEEVNVEQFTALFVSADTDSGINNLVWIDEQNKRIFSVDSTLEKSVILHIAESIELLYSTN